MKKNLIFFIFIFIYGCESIPFKSQEIAVIDCPNVFFSSENSVYTHGYTESLDLEKIDFYDIRNFWDKIEPEANKLILDPGAFYILMSKETVTVPPGYAAEMAPYLAMVGEFRVHYAGFFDPGFGYIREGGAGSRGVLEVRCHEAPFIMQDGQMIGRLIYERMAEIPEVLYGHNLDSNYQGQRLKLSKHFKN